jgi:hypothetical protein
MVSLLSPEVEFSKICRNSSMHTMREGASANCVSKSWRRESAESSFLRSGSLLEDVVTALRFLILMSIHAKCSVKVTYSALLRSPSSEITPCVDRNAKVPVRPAETLRPDSPSQTSVFQKLPNKRSYHTIISNRGVKPVVRSHGDSRPCFASLSCLVAFST